MDPPDPEVEDVETTLSSLMKAVTIKDASEPTTPKILTMPPEVLNHVMSHLNIVDSTCLGLTCKRAYAMHLQRYSGVYFSLGAIFVARCCNAACPQLPPPGRHLRQDCDPAYAPRIAPPVSHFKTTLEHAQYLVHVLLGMEACPRDENCVLLQGLRLKEPRRFCAPFRHLKEWMGDDMRFCWSCNMFLPKGDKETCERCGQVDPEVPKRMARRALQ